MKNTTHVITLLATMLFAQTDQQIKQAKQIIMQTGMSENQVRDAAKQQGFTNEQIDAAIQKEKGKKVGASKQDINQFKDLNSSQNTNLNKDSQQNQNLEIIEDEESFIDTYNTDEDDLDIESEVQPSKQKNPYFGYDIFSRDPSLFQASSVGAVDPDYLIGPGDEIIVMLWGETQFRQVLDVDREGFVFIPEIGQVFVNGLDLNLLESKLFRVFSQSYASLDPQGRQPSSFLDVSLGNLRPLRIQVLGEVNQPGAYTVSPSATLFSALYYFNGPKISGSLRNIQLIRGGEQIATIDFYDYLLTGKRPKDEKLQLDDVIYIPRRLKTISIEGAINRSAIYELKPQESLIDLIEMAGDLKMTAYLGRSQIDRIVPFGEREKLGMDRMYVDVNLENIIKAENNFELIDGDRIQIFSILDARQNVVELTGAVTRPGIYHLGDSLKIKDLINKADGLLGDAYLGRIDVVRTNQDLNEQLIKLDLAKALEGNLRDNIKLQGLDKVKVYGMMEMIEKVFVTIDGQIKKPGRYLLQDNMRIYDLIFKAGGFLDSEFKKQIYLRRADLIRKTSDAVNSKIISFNLGDLLDSPQSKANILLEPNDFIRIYPKQAFLSTKSVKINGVVRKPGTYELKDKMTLKDLILESGGLSESVYRYQVEIARIDTLNKDLNQYAEIINLNMDENFKFRPYTEIGSLETKSSNKIGQFVLNPYDLISIRPDPYFIKQKQVIISGEILFPGDYTIKNSDEKITDIIARAGGLRPNAYASASQYIRKGNRIFVDFEKILKNPKSPLNFNVQDGDQILIVPSPNIIVVSGQVNSPGIHKHEPRKRLRHYIRLAGGLNPDADANNIWVQYPNGDSKKLRNWSIFSPRILDGSTINIGKKKEEEPFDKTEFAKEVSSIIANLAQAVTVIILARN